MIAIYRFVVLVMMISSVNELMASNSQQAIRKDQIFGYVYADAESLNSSVEEGEAAYLAAKNVLGLTDKAFAVIDEDYTSAKWGDLSPDGKPMYVWAFRKRTNSQKFPPFVYLLRHEIGHDLFIRYLIPSTKNDQYGGDAPDWLDEMAAVAFEGEPLRTIRRRSAARYAKELKLIELQRFFNMTHPELATVLSSASPDATAAAFESTSADTGPFYATASAFYDFLVYRTKSPAIIAELAAAFRNGEPLDQWILKYMGYRSGNDGIKALNIDFLGWLDSDPRYGVKTPGIRD